MFNFEAPSHALSFGQVSNCLLYEFFKRGISPNFFVIGNGIDLSAFDKAGDDFKNYIQSCSDKSIKNFKKDIPYLKLWHIQSSHHKISSPSYLLTFHECSKLTSSEVNILNSYNGIFVTSTYSKKVFEENGVTVPIHYIPIGFDNLHFRRENTRVYSDDRLVWGIFAKYEECRKNHKQLIRAWIKRFGHNPKHCLHLHITNPFFKPEQMNAAYADIFENKPAPFNVILYGFQQTNTLMNKCYNAIDIVLDLSGGESISIPSLTCIGIGKHGVIMDATGMSDWLKLVKCQRVQPNGLKPAQDGIFFHGLNSPFNIGEFYTFSDDDFVLACENAMKDYINNPINDSGYVLQKEYGYEQAVTKILNVINSK